MENVDGLKVALKMQHWNKTRLSNSPTRPLIGADLFHFKRPPEEADIVVTV